MKVVIIATGSKNQQTHASWMREGLKRHGIDASLLGRDAWELCDVLIVWGWRRQSAIEQASKLSIPVLVMERGHIPPRLEWTSLGWNGLAGRGKYPLCLDDGTRFNAHFGPLMQPWKDGGSSALIMGQVPGDMALYGADAVGWANALVADLNAKGYERIVYRPHPDVLARGDAWHPVGTQLSRVTLAEDLTQAKIAISYSSTSGVEAVLAGTPHVAFHEGSMAWPVSAHRALEEIRPDRTAWAHALAWTQWKPKEIREGTAWDAVRTCVELQCADSASARTFFKGVRDILKW